AIPQWDPADLKRRTVEIAFHNTSAWQHIPKIRNCSSTISVRRTHEILNIRDTGTVIMQVVLETTTKCPMEVHVLNSTVYFIPLTRRTF
ncbi:hypothetical protein PENTCL1PPCAC_20823, partial [Pristionchus entomophagus]